ncbi:hypothetical protein BDY21DRAFT_286128 [Lineolata rhizophorae]|uniref:WHIM1 domain-containing protein n=1 Tax=Lineolata rhizophorae TaxID=578093 RepID=A0A6A6P021_9PEZI|nr:hypothetical protein BDY21DRAFT_286128 [Lineolata rhizophorae]
MAASPAPSPRKKRPASPPHEEVLADNPDIAFLVMFRARFSDCFPPKVPNLGPQDIERGVVDSAPSPQVEHLLCALLALVLNRKKPVERGHYGRALEDAIQSHKSEWPRAWNNVNPLSGGKSFNTMSPQERLSLLRALVLWSLHTSDVISATMKESYKQSRQEDDRNQPLSVQPWGIDGEKRRYWLIEGRDDTNFRLYRETNPKQTPCRWWSMAGTLDELRAIAERLGNEESQAARRLATQILNAIPRFEATEEKRKRREYRQARKAQFSRPEPGFSLYEGRTRGKRMRYTFSDDEDELLQQSDSTSAARRSARHSARATPAEPARPTVTASGRQVRSRVGGAYGEALLSGPTTDRGTPATADYARSDASNEDGGSGGRPTRGSRSAAQRPNGRWAAGGKNHIEGYNSVDEMEDEDEAASTGDDEWDGDAELDMGDDDGDDGASETGESDLDEEKKLVVKLKYRAPAAAKKQEVKPTLVEPKEEPMKMEVDSAAPSTLQRPSSPPKPTQPVVTTTNGYNLPTPASVAAKVESTNGISHVPSPKKELSTMTNGLIAGPQDGTRSSPAPSASTSDALKLPTHV